ncbi:MAG TPA: 50S ribosomal protein L11 methyltransferase [Afifellaceae bacterium]|nr:50S ribosomal protein L11 methyltransferase [Afifellaceae bacterium]
MTLKATFTAGRPEATRIAAFLERDYGDSGAAICLIEGAPDWSVEAYFANDEDPASLAARIRDRLGGDAFGAPLAVERLGEEDWVARGLAELSPVAAGRFLVLGSHDLARAPKGRKTILVEAGQAFGTGHHATTRGCLVVLDRLVARRRFVNALDLGTGSGVLAIALAKLLNRPVLATDIDPVAVAVAKQNAKRNGVATLVRAVAADGLSHPEVAARAPFDLVVANILAGPLIGMAPLLARGLVRGGVLVLSGLLDTQRSRVAAAYAAEGIPLQRAERFGDWSVLVLQRP